MNLALLSELRTLIFKKLSVSLFCLALFSLTSAQAAVETNAPEVISVATTESELVIESKSGTVTYKAVWTANRAATSRNFVCRRMAGQS